MSSIKTILNVFYQPTDELKQLIQTDEQHERLFFPINGGSQLSDAWCNQHLHKDNTGENISELNLLLNEMTAVYWFWKNYRPLPDYVGFNHYRRLFKQADIADYEKFDIIVAKPVFSSPNSVLSLAAQYMLYHNINDLQICLAVVSQIVSVEYAKAFKSYLQTAKINYAPCNMFVMKKELFEEWCEFVFPILFKLKDVICNAEQFKQRDNYQKRALCFLTERIFNFWCYSKHMSGFAVKEVDIEQHLDFKPTKVNERGDYSI